MRPIPEPKYSNSIQKVKHIWEKFKKLLGSKEERVTAH